MGGCNRLPSLLSRPLWQLVTFFPTADPGRYHRRPLTLSLSSFVLTITTNAQSNHPDSTKSDLQSLKTCTLSQRTVVSPQNLDPFSKATLLLSSSSRMISPYHPSLFSSLLIVRLHSLIPSLSCRHSGFVILQHISSRSLSYVTCVLSSSLLSSFSSQSLALRKYPSHDLIPQIES